MSGFFGIIIINSSSSRSRNSNNNRRSIRLRSRNKTNQKEVLEWEKQKSRNLDFPRNQQQQPRPSYQSINQEVEETYDRNQNQNQSHGGEGIESQQTALLSIEYGKYRNIIGMKGGGGEIVQVQGGHIVRSTGRKDRHSKVFTAKGPRDRRVRLSAHTAIQFYDVQDRLGYDRPSKAVDWLIKKAKSAIDKLAELPPWHPISQDPNAASGTSDIALAQHSHDSNYVFPPFGGGGGEENPGNDSAFIAPPLESDPIADTMKSFFPTSSGTSSMNYQSYPPDSSYQNQDLCLSLHSFQDPDGDSNHKSLLAGAAQVGYETNFQRMVSWGGGGGGDSERNGGFGFMFNSPHMPMPQPTPLLGQGSEFSQRGTLQSSFAPAFRAWNELPFASGAMHQSSLADGRFLPGFRIPARIQGEEDHSAVSDRPSSSSPNNSHH